MLEISSFSAVDCGALSFPLNGSSYGGSTTFPNSVHFSCDPCKRMTLPEVFAWQKVGPPRGVTLPNR